VCQCMPCWLQYIAMPNAALLSGRTIIPLDRLAQLASRQLVLPVPNERSWQRITAQAHLHGKQQHCQTLPDDHITFLHTATSLHSWPAHSMIHPPTAHLTPLFLLLP
jgi:hypothetical protein